MSKVINFVTDYPVAHGFIKAFLDTNSVRPKFVFGTNHEAIEISQQVKLDGFIDDLIGETSFSELPVIRSQDIPKDALVVVVALMRPVTLHKKLKSLNIEHLHSVALMRFSDLKLSQPWFWEGFDQDFVEHRHFYEAFDEQLADQASVKIFRNIINFRLTGNMIFLTDFEDRQAEQYFESFLNLRIGDSFVDIGGFDGQSATQFVKNCPNFEAIHLFEPELNNMKVAKLACSALENVYFHQYAVSDESMTLGILESGSTSKIVAQGEGDYDIQTVRLDDVLLAHKVSFLKMDIEGVELRALKGAEQIIRQQHPRLAICVYHHGTDFRIIFQTVKAFNPAYKCYIRHYTEGVVETVMFFID